MATKYRLLGILLAFFAHPLWASPHIADFETAHQAFVERSGCGAAKTLPQSDRHGFMANCVTGDGRTVVWELEKSRDDESVHRIRFTWFDFAVNDPTEAKRFAPGVDKHEAERMVDVFLETYAPCIKDKVRDGFFGQAGLEERNATGHQVAVKHFHNPSLVERVIEIRPLPES